MQATRIAKPTQRIHTDGGLNSVALARIMEEVKNDTDRHPTAYNRVHNRHNR